MRTNRCLELNWRRGAKRSLCLFILLVAGVMSSVCPATDGSRNVYLHLSGAKAGPIRGSVTAPGYQGAIRVYDSSLSSDSDSAGATKALQVIIPLDTTFPVLNQAHQIGDSMTVALRYTRQEGASTGSLLEMSVDIRDARIADIRTQSPDATGDQTQTRVNVRFEFETVAEIKHHAE